MAGFALHQKYKSQFQKVLTAISRDFLGKLKGRPDAQDYSPTIYSLETREFLKEPEGRRLQGALLSSTCVPDQEYQQGGYGYSNSYHRGY